MKRVHSQTGITLIEVLASVAILAIVAGGMTTSTVSNIILNSNSKAITAATALLQNKIEQIRSIAPVAGQIPAELTPGIHYDTNNPMTALGAANGTFTRSWTVSNVSQYLNGSVVGAKPALVQVGITVSWTTPVGGRVTAVTYACTTSNCG